MTKGLIVLDGDDTLWRSQHLYTEARRECMRTVKALGLNPRRWLNLQVAIDSALVDSFQFSREQFPTASREAYRRLAGEAGSTPNEATAAQIYAIAASVFQAQSQPYPGTASALQSLRDAGYTLVLLTKGDPGVQAKRIVDSGLGGLLDQVLIVAKKTPEMFRSICAWAGVRPEEAISVGNSLRSDIAPAVLIGMQGIHIPHETWAYEVGGDPLPLTARVVTVRRISQIAAILDRQRRALRPGPELAA